MTMMTKTCAKVVRDGKVAVLVSPSFGAGWYTWVKHKAGGEDCLFCPELVAMIERSAPFPEIEAFIKSRWPDAYTGGVRGLEICWVPEGSSFRIDEYDGSEELVLRDEEAWIVA